MLQSSPITTSPTIVELAGGQWPSHFDDLTVPPVPGKSLVPVFEKDFSVKHDYIWWFHEGNRAIRIADWKLVSHQEKQWELYDMGKDRSESKNLASQFPEKVKEMEKAWTAHLEEFRALAGGEAVNGPKNSPKRAKTN